MYIGHIHTRKQPLISMTKTSSKSSLAAWHNVHCALCCSPRLEPLGKLGPGVDRRSICNFESDSVHVA